MKIYCEKCKEEISLKVDMAFDNYNVGRVECDKCKKNQTRYISESDLLLYYGISEIIYVVISLVTNAMLTAQGFTAWMVAIIAVILIVYFIVQKQISRLIYTKAYFKESFKNYDFKEDSKAVNKSMRWQFVLFFAIAITFMFNDKFTTVFGILLVVSVILTFIKYYFALQKEKKIIAENENTKKLKENN